MTTPTVTETRRHGGRVGERVELARYTLPAGERILYGQRVDGVVRVTDVPAHGRGRAYLVERELEQDGYSALKALISDYVQQGELLARRAHGRLAADRHAEREPQRGWAMILNVHVQGASPYDIGDEIWQVSLADAITAEAETIAGHAGADLLESSDPAHRNALGDRIVHDMTSALVRVGDRYRAPDGVLYALIDEGAAHPRGGEDRVTAVSPRTSEPIVDVVLRFEDLPLGSPGTRRAIVRWSDATEDAAMTWFADEILVCEGDLVGKTRAEIRSLHFRRDCDWLQS